MCGRKQGITVFARTHSAKHAYVALETILQNIPEEVDIAFAISTEEPYCTLLENFELLIEGYSLREIIEHFGKG